jgi:hypothetical protein
LPPRQVLRNTPAADPPWPVRRLLRGRKIEYIETRRRCGALQSAQSPGFAFFGLR